jgi:hypothetical protein
MANPVNFARSIEFADLHSELRQYHAKKLQTIKKEATILGDPLKFVLREDPELLLQVCHLADDEYPEINLSISQLTALLMYVLEFSINKNVVPSRFTASNWRLDKKKRMFADLQFQIENSDSAWVGELIASLTERVARNIKLQEQIANKIKKENDALMQNLPA